MESKVETKVERILCSDDWKHQQGIYNNASPFMLFALWAYNPLYYRFSLLEMYDIFMTKLPTYMRTAIHKSLFFKNLMYAIVNQNRDNVECNTIMNAIMTILESSEAEPEASLASSNQTHPVIKKWIISDGLLTQIRRNIAKLNQSQLLNSPMPLKFGLQLTTLWSHSYEMEEKALIAQKQKEEKEKQIQKKRTLSAAPRNWRSLKADQRLEIRNIHTGYPQVHPELGQPKLSMLKCMYKGCATTAPSEIELDQHLRIACGNRFIQGLHRSHAEIVKSMQLTTEKVLGEKMVKCPSLICDKTHETFSAPEQLIYHFQQLGIAPFWSRGWEEKQDDQTTNKKQLKEEPENENKTLETSEQQPQQVLEIRLTHHINIPINENSHDDDNDDSDTDSCLCCFDSRRDVVFQPCQHQVLCLSCASKMNLKKFICALCRSPIVCMIPTIL